MGISFGKQNLNNTFAIRNKAQMNKKLLLLPVLFFAILAMVSCKTKNDPKNVAKEWLNDFFHLDYDAAKKISTEDTKNLLSQVQQLASMIPDSVKQAYKKATVTIKNVNINGDKATVTYIVSDNPALEQPLNLVKTNGQWLVLYTKEDQPDPSSAGAITDPADSSMNMVPTDSSMADTSHTR
jgi:Domain of unknown function (DUF4878)